MTDKTKKAFEQVDDGKMTWQEAIDSLVKKYRKE